MPKDANLDLIRIEMLNHGAEYAWLDVLCLRQEGGKNEDLRSEEWKLDVPTIGSVYEEAPKVVCYFNGLGRPLDLPTNYFESDHCWFRRAWTLQEITEDVIIGGQTGNGFMEKEVQQRFDGQLASLREMIIHRRILDLVSEMQTRVSTKPLDKVAGLVYLLKTDSIPIYDAEQSAAEAWEVLVDVMQQAIWTQLLFFYPKPGDGRTYWRPLWEQITTKKTMAHYFGWCKTQVHREGQDGDYHCGHRIHSCNVRGLSEVPKEPKPRQGQLVVKDVSHTFKIMADHAYPIPDGFYTLIGNYEGFSLGALWAVGQLREDGKFKKLSVFRVPDDERWRLWECGFQADTFLC
ncbi:hypothetical protein F5146DRAFT_1193612 [Armillaria mellea]|nr:hypothetical protein F5146DRAFT_1193612 [Armillaria mellea]